MAQSLAKVTCPNCQQPFSASIEQILDAGLDPSVKARLLSGQVNLVQCPHCQMTGGISMPFIYHDADKELALVFMPMEAGSTDLERQQFIGTLSRAVMAQMPTEQRKGYLLDPQVFLVYEGLVNRVLEADGITPEMIEAQKSKADLLRKLLDAAPEERVPLITENEELLDEEFFQILHVNLEQINALGQEDLLQQILDVRTALFENTALGRRLAKQSETLAALQEDPTREKLLELLVASDDEVTRTALIAFGQPLLDYFFFQSLTQRIEKAKDSAEKKRLEALRQEILSVREEMQAQARTIVESRAALLRQLLMSEEPELVARRHVADLDDLFFGVLGTEIERAQNEGNTEAAAQLQAVWQMTMQLLGERMPPGLVLLTQLLDTQETSEMQKILEENRPLVNQAFLKTLEQVREQMGEENVEASAKISTIITLVQPMVE